MSLDRLFGYKVHVIGRIDDGRLQIFNNFKSVEKYLNMKSLDFMNGEEIIFKSFRENSIRSSDFMNGEEIIFKSFGENSIRSSYIATIEINYIRSFDPADKSNEIHTEKLYRLTNIKEITNKEFDRIEMEYI